MLHVVFAEKLADRATVAAARGGDQLVKWSPPVMPRADGSRSDWEIVYELGMRLGGMRFGVPLVDVAQALVLIGRRHLRSNNSWMHNCRSLVRGPS